MPSSPSESRAHACEQAREAHLTPYILTASNSIARVDDAPVLASGEEIGQQYTINPSPDSTVILAREIDFGEQTTLNEKNIGEPRETELLLSLEQAPSVPVPQQQREEHQRQREPILSPTLQESRENASPERSHSIPEQQPGQQHDIEQPIDQQEQREEQQKQPPQQEEPEATPRTLTRRQLEKQREKRANALQELMHTERHYCERLGLACALFLRGETVATEPRNNYSNDNHQNITPPLNTTMPSTVYQGDATHFCTASLAPPKNAAYTRLFSSIEEIVAMHQTFCEALEREMMHDAVAEETQVGPALR
jgi:hypothetical protein